MCCLLEGYGSGGPSSKCTFNVTQTVHHEGSNRLKNDKLYMKIAVQLSYMLQMLQWCVLAGFGVMHFLQTDTEGI